MKTNVKNKFLASKNLRKLIFVEKQQVKHQKETFEKHRWISCSYSFAHFINFFFKVFNVWYRLIEHLKIYTLAVENVNNSFLCVSTIFYALLMLNVSISKIRTLLKLSLKVSIRNSIMFFEIWKIYTQILFYDPNCLQTNFHGLNTLTSKETKFWKKRRKSLFYSLSCNSMRVFEQTFSWLRQHIFP